jgi:copper chaperone CopZ
MLYFLTFIFIPSIMKTLFMISAIYLALMATASAQAPISKAELVASGLTCSICSNSIYKALVRLPFIDHVTPDLEHSSYHITFKKPLAVDIDAIKEAVRGAGFSVSSLTLTMSLTHVAVQNDADVVLGGQTFHFLHVPPEILNGETTVKVVDKDFLPAALYKQFGSPKGTSRTYHVTI